MRHLILLLLSFPFFSWAQPETLTYGKWRELGPTESPENSNLTDYSYTRIKGTGRLIFIEFDERLPNRIFTGSPTGGLFVSDDKGESWRVGGTDHLFVPGVSHIQVAPESSDTWFIASGDGDTDFTFSIGVARTKDAGKTWEWINGVDESLPVTELNKPWNVVRIRKLLVDPKNGNRLWAATTEGLFLTENALAPTAEVRWRKLAGGAFQDLCFQPESRGRTVLASGRELWMSTDSGTHFNKIEIPRDFSVITDDLPEKWLTIRMSADAPNLLYVAYTANEGHGSRRFNAELYTFHLIDKRWSFIREFGKDMGAQKQMGHGRHQSIAVHPKDASTLYWGNVLRVHKSEDGGNTWEDLTRGIGVSNMFNIGSSMSHPAHVSYGGFDTGNVWRDDQGVWRQVFFGDGFKSVPLVTDSTIGIYCSSSSGFGYMEPDGRTDFRTPSRNVAGYQWKVHFAVDLKDEDLLYLAAPKGVMRSWNRGEEWEMLKEAPKGAEVWEVYLNEHDPNELYFTSISGTEGIWRTRDARNEMALDIEWERLVPSIPEFKNGEPIKLTIADIEPDPFNPGAFWVAFGRQENGFEGYPNPKVLYYNGSRYEDWTGIARGDAMLQDRKVLEIEADPALSGRIYIGTSAGVFVKEGFNGAWSQEWGIPHAEVRELELHPYARVLRAATFGRGLWEMPLPAVEAEIKVRGEQHWTDRSILTHLVVKNGAVLHLKGETWMAYGVRITVEPGGAVEVHGTIEVLAGTAWKGFDVQSSKGFLFFKGKSGEVRYSNR